MTKLSFSVPGTPRGKASPRHNSRGFTYTDPKTKEYMDRISIYAQRAMKEAGLQPTDCPCVMTFRAYFAIPASYSLKDKRAIKWGNKRYIKKPDTDNISKCKDALTGIVFNDDKQVWCETIIKEYGQDERLDITVDIQTPVDSMLNKSEVKTLESSA